MSELTFEDAQYVRTASMPADRHAKSPHCLQFPGPVDYPTVGLYSRADAAA